MTLKEAQVAMRLKILRKALADPKWSKWWYTESTDMYLDIRDYVQELDKLIDILNGTSDEHTRS